MGLKRKTRRSGVEPVEMVCEIVMVQPKFHIKIHGILINVSMKRQSIAKKHIPKAKNLLVFFALMGLLNGFR